MNNELIALLKENIGGVMTWEAAAKIYELSTRVAQLLPPSQLAGIEPEEYGAYTFSLERLADILEEMKPLHQSHWNEKEEEEGRPGFNPDYDTFLRHERAGRALVFTLRKEGRLIGNFSVYVSRSMHTQALRSTEDTLYILPEERKGRLAARLMGYAERVLKGLGVTELNITVKISNRHGRYFQMIGYQHVSNGLTKLLED